MNNDSKSYLKLYLRLRQQECILEKSAEAFLINCSVNPKVWQSIKEDVVKFEKERQKSVNLLKETVSDIYQDLKSIKLIINVENIEKIDVETFKNKLQLLWKKIQNFKNSCNISLNEEQNCLENDLNNLMRSIRKQKTIDPIDNFYCKPLNFKNKSQKNECTYEKVEDFCTLLAKAGHTGNWSEEDHLLYLKLRKKHKSIPALVNAIQAKCPDLTKECIIDHERWYKTYLELREKQKIAVQEWRKRKESERLAKVTEKIVIRKNEAAADIDDATNTSVSAEKDSSTTGTDNFLKNNEQKKIQLEKKKEMVKEWKEQKEKLKAEEEKRLNVYLKAKRELRENRRRARATRLKKLVVEYKGKKSSELKQCNNENRNSLESPVSAFILQYYRARDQKFVEKRRNILSSKMSPQKPQPMKSILNDYSKIKESTLFKDTIAWQEKYRRVDPKPTQIISYIKDVPKRTIVGWKSYETLYRQR